MMRRALYEDLHGKEKQQRDVEPAEEVELGESDGVNVHDEEKKSDAEQSMVAGKEAHSRRNLMRAGCARQDRAQDEQDAVTRRIRLRFESE
jgi:hypothetical protein